MREGVLHESLGVWTDMLGSQEIIDWVFNWLKITILGKAFIQANICLAHPTIVDYGNRYGRRYGYSYQHNVKLNFNPSRMVVFEVIISSTQKSVRNGRDERDGCGDGGHDNGRMQIPFYHYYGDYQVFPLEECSICMENECQVMDVGCGHLLYCLNCYLDLVRSQGGSGFALEECPICRNPRRQLVYVQNDHELDEIQIPV